MKLQDMIYDNIDTEDEEVEDDMNDEQSCIMKLKEMFKKIRRNNGKLNYVVVAKLQMLNMYRPILTFQHVGIVHMI